MRDSPVGPRAGPVVGRRGHESPRGALRGCLVARLRARRAEIEVGIFARVSEPRFDQRGRDDPGYVVGLRAAGDAALDYVLVGVECWGEFLEPVPAAVLAQARRAALAGVGLETVMRRYIAGHAVLEDFVMQEADSGVLRDRRAVVREVLAILSVLVDRLSVAVSSAYSKELERLAGEATDAVRAAEPDGHRVDRTEGPAALGAAREQQAGSTQRERILRAFVEVVVERGLADTPVGLVLARAKVSSRTLYELFPGGLEECLLTVLEETGQRVIELAARRLGQAASWQEGVRGTLAALLVFFDSEPALARVCFVEALAGGQLVVERREAAVTAFRELIVAYVEHAAAQDVSPLLAEATIASVMSIVYTRLLRREPTPLIELLGPLMGLLMAPVGASEEIVAEETRLGEELARAIRAGAPGWQTAIPGPATGAQSRPPRSLPELPAPLANPSARRARQCLLYIAQRAPCGHRPSNSEIASAIGVQNKGQISRLLSQLQQHGLLTKHSTGVAAPNAWSLTPQGKAAARALAEAEPPTEAEPPMVKASPLGSAIRNRGSSR